MNLKGILVGGTKILILFLALLNILHIFAQTPVANVGMRVADAEGEWRVPAEGLLYEAAIYHRERAVDFLFAAAGAPEPGEGDEDARTAMVEAAREAASRSVAEAPADASSWVLLAWAEALLGNDPAATLALARSWELAPNSLALAFDRVVLAETLAVLDAGETMPAVLDSLRRDVEILRSGDRATWASVQEAAPGVVARFEPAEQST